MLFERPVEGRGEHGSGGSEHGGGTEHGMDFWNMAVETQNYIMDIPGAGREWQNGIDLDGFQT